MADAPPPDQSADDPTSGSEQEIVPTMLAEIATALGRCTYPVSQSRVLVEKAADAYGYKSGVIALLPTLSIVGNRQTGGIAMQELTGSYRFDQIASAQAEVAVACSGTKPPEDVLRSLRAIPNQTPLFPTWLRILGYGATALGFACLFQMTFQSLAIAAMLGILVGVALLWGNPGRQVSALMPVVLTFASAVVVSVVAVWANIPDPARLAVIPVLALIPGAALATSVIELFSGDMTAGSSRLIYAIMLLLSITFAFTLAVQLVGAGENGLTDVTAQTAPPWVVWLGVVIFGLGYSLFYCTPLNLWIPTLTLLVFSHLVLNLCQTVMTPPLSAGVTIALALIVAWVLNDRTGTGPVSLVLFLPTFWMIVPGSTGFVALTGVVEKNQDLSDLGLQVALTVVSMSVGIMIASLIYPHLQKRVGRH